MPATSPSFDLRGTRALVTGGGSGLGFAIARALASAGAHVVLNGRNRDKLSAASASLATDGLDASWDRLSVGSVSVLHATNTAASKAKAVGRRRHEDVMERTFRG